MKSLAIALITIVSAHAMAAQTYTYDCQGLTTKVIVGDVKPTVKLSFKNQNDKGIINIASNSSLKSESEDNALDFVNFAYPSGDAYVEAENQTGEEGFTFTLANEALQGASTVKATTTYYSEFAAKPDVETLTCTLK
ncbi:MAG TPA: hypothetical protein VF412_08270 [Bdellovibrio sp.]|uniref:hypothetical protein n=1 Tax=Bdellovibrio sp. TaxID=28201 RepID=UPI002EF70146